MIRAGRRVLPVFLLAALAVLFSVLLITPWSVHAQTVPTLQVEDVSIKEGAARLKFKVTLADGARATEVVTVDYATADGEALTGNDYAGTSGTVTISYGESFGFIFVALHDDRVPEFDETFTLTLSNPSNAALPGGASSVAVTGTIIDNEGPYLTIKALESDIFTGVPAVFEAARTGSTEEALSISFEIRYLYANGSIIPLIDGQEGTVSLSYISFAPGERKVEWQLEPVGRIEEIFLFQVKLEREYWDDYDYDPTPVRVRVQRRPVHQSLDIPDPDGTLPAVSIIANPGGDAGVPSLSEDQGATFTLARTGDVSSPLAVRVYTEESFHPDWTPGTPNPTAAFHDVTFTAGSTTATLSVDIHDDGVTERADWLEAHVSPTAGSSYRKGTPHRAYVNIIGDDVDDRESVSLGKAPYFNRLWFNEGEPVFVAVFRDDLDDRGLRKPLTYRVLVSQDGSGVPEDWLGIIAPVHIRYNEANYHDVILPTLANDGDEPDTAVTFTLLESPHYTINPDKASVTVTVRDLDPPPVLEIADATARGGVDSIDFQVSFADGVPSRQDVSVDYRTQDGTATAGQDYSNTRGTLTIPAGETGGVITVPLLPETAEGRDETFDLQLRDPVNATLSGGETRLSATATVSYRPEIRMRALDAEVLEGDPARFELTRTGSTAAELTVRVNTREPNSPLATFSDNPTDIDREVTFPAGAGTAILAVDTVQDNTDEGQTNFLRAELLDGSKYKRKTKDPVFVNIFDTIPDVTVAADQETIVEDDIEEGEGKDVTFTLTRAGDASDELTVKVRVDDPEMIRCFDHLFWRTFCRDGPTFEEEVTFAEDSATATLAVKIYNDWRDVPDGAAVTVTLIDENGYRPGDPDSAGVTLVDNDFASHLALSDDAVVAEGEEVRFIVWRGDQESDIDAYQEHVPWTVTDSRPGRPNETDVTVMEPGRNSFTKTIEVPDDDKAGGDWTYTFSIDRIEKNNLGQPLDIEVEQAQYFRVLRDRSVTVTVRDAGGPRVTIAADRTAVTEGETANFTLTRPGDTSEALAVRVSVEDPSHYMRGNHIWPDPQPPTTVEFAAGSATTTLSLPTADDWRDIPDDDLTVTIEPGDDDEYRPGDQASASVTVRDNNTRPVFHLSVNKETLTEGENVLFTVTRTVDFTHEMSVVVYAGIQGETRSRWLAFPPGKTVETIGFSTEDDDLDEADVVYEIRVANPRTDYRTVAAPHTLTATVVDDDLPRVGIEALSDSYEEGDYARFRLTREGQTNSDLPVRFRLTQTGRVVYHSPEYTFGERTATIYETTSAWESGFRISKGDGDEEDGAVALEVLPSDDYVIDPDKATDSFTVIDTDPPPTLMAFAPPVAEGDGEIRLVVNFDELPPRRDERVTVDYSILPGTATEGVDYTAVSGTLTFEPGQEPLYITVPVIQDSLPEPDETFFLVLTNAQNARLPSRERSTTVTIKDDEPHVIVVASYGETEITEGETASFSVIRDGDTTEELSVQVSLLVGRPGSDLAELLDHSVTIPAGRGGVQLDHDTEDDDLDAPPFTIFAIVRDPADFNLPSTYLPPVEQAYVTVLDNDVATVTVEAANQSKLFGEVRFNLTREGDPADPLTVSLDITQAGVLDNGDPLPDSASFATGTSTATFEAGSSTTNVRLTATKDFSHGGQSFSMDRGLVIAALADSDDYITGDPASATTLVFERIGDFPFVYIDDAGTVMEGEDLVFTLHRTGDAETSLTAWMQMRVRKFASFIPYSYQEVTFEAGSHTTTFTVPTQDNDLNDGNRWYRVNLVLSSTFDDGVAPHSLTLGYQIGYQYPAIGEGWVRDDDIPTVWVTPETGDHFEDPEGGSPQFTVHRDSYTSTWSYVFTSTRQLRRWPPPIPDSLYTNTGLPKNADDAFWLLPGESSLTRKFDPRFVGPLGGEAAVFLLPNYCGEDVLADCYTYPQYHIGTPSSGLIQVYNRFAGIMVEPVEAEVEEGEDAVFRLTRFGGTPVSNDHPLTVWIEVTQDGEYIEGMPPQTVKFRGWPETTVDEADDTITLSIPTTDDDDDERHGAITLRVLPPETIDVNEPSSYEAGVEQLLIPFETGTVRVNDNDYYPPPMSISDARAGEADGSMDFFVTVAPSELEMSVNWNTVTESGVGVATANADYDSASGTLTFAVGETIKKITVDVLDDELNETEETFKVVLSGPNNATLGDSSGAGVIEDDDEGTVVTIHPLGPYGGTEEGKPAEFILQRVGSTGAIYVDLEISQEGEFLWSLQPTTISQQIPAGVNEVTVAINTIDDNAVEANGSVTATVKATRDYYSPGKPDAATVNMRDNDRILSISDAEAGEGDGSITFTVALSAAAENRVRVEVFTSPGKATSDANITETSLGKDFEPKTEFLVFAPGETEKSFTVTLVDDDIDESAEDFTVTLYRPTSNVWVTDASATGTILDNDDPMEARIVREVRRVDENQGTAVLFAVELVHENTVGSERDTRLYWEVKPGEATQDEDYAKPYSQERGTLKIPIGHLTANLEIDLIDDNLLERQLETFTVELVGGQSLVLPQNDNRRTVRISIRDDERLTAAISPVTDSVIEGEDAVFEVRLSGGVTTENTVLEYTVAGTADSGDDYTVPDDYTVTGGTLTIAAGSDTGAITIPVLVDSALDPDETVEVTLVSGASGERKARIPDPVATVTILETGTLTVSVSPAEAEEGGTLSFAVTLSLASQDDVTVEWQTADDPEAVSAATAGVDYTAASGTLTVPAGLTSAVITVETSEDTLAAEGDETFRVNLTRARSASPSALDDLPLGVSTAVGTIWDNDIAPTGMTLSASPDRVSENAGATAITVTATLSGQRSLARDTRVQLALEGGSAAADEDYEPATAVLTIPAGQMNATATLTLTPVDDTVWEGDETVTISGTAGDLSVTPAEVTITDDDAAPTGVTLTLAPAVIGEAAGETDLTVTATLTGGDSSIVDTEIELSVEGVSLTPDDGNGSTTAATGDDFTYAAVTLTIPAGRTSGSATLTFTPEDDTMVEDDETAQVTGTAEGLIVTSAGLTIEDDDQEPTRIGLSVSPAEVKEGDGATTLTVTATLEGGGSRTSATAVSLTVAGVTAMAGDDFTAQTGVTLTIPAGQLSHTAELTLTPVDDNLAEGREELSIGGSNAEPGLPVTGVRAAIADNDAEPTNITLSLNKDYIEENRGSQWITVTASLDGTSRRTVDTSVRLRVAGGTATTADYWALAGDLVIEAGERQGTADIVLVPTDDHIDEDDETLEVWGTTNRSRSRAPLQVSREQVTIRDDDVAGVTVTPTELPVVEGQSNSYRVVLDSQPTGDVTIAVNAPADTDITLSGATLTNDALTFTAGNWNIAQEVTVTAGEDDDSTPSPDVTLTHTVSGGDYEGLKADDVVVSITEDDEPGVTISESALSIDEGDSATYTVVLDTKPTADVTVAIAGHADTDITLSGDTLTDDTLTFTSENWNTAQTVTVTAAEDDDAVDEEEATLTHTANGGDYDAVTADVVVSITDNDTADVTISKTELTIGEGGSDTYTVVLDSEPTAEVKVAIAGHADTDITLSGDTLADDTLTFTSDNWDTAQTVTVTAAEDDDAVNEEEVTLAHTVAGTAEYAGVTAGSVTVTIVEKDTSVLAVSDAEAAEDGGNVVFTVSISAASGEEVTVGYATSDGTATAGQDYTETSGTLTFPANSVASQTISVPVTDDTVDEDEEETFTLTLSNVEGASLSGGTSTLAVTGTITDNDNPAVTASFKQANYSVVEGSTVEVTVTLSADPEREVTVLLTHDPQGNTGSGDYSGVPGSVVFQIGDTEKSFTFTATADDIDDDGESVALGFRATPDDVTAGTTATVTITDDDTAGVTVSKTALTIEEGGSGTYTVVLDTKPTADVTIAIAGHADTDITLSGATLTDDALTFTSENWNTAQTVTVTAAQDDDAASDNAVTLTHTVTGTAEYADVTAGSVTVTITDDESASPSLDLSLPVPTNNDADDSGDVTLNDVLTYTATATNDGNVSLSGVTLSDLLVDEDGHDCGSLDIGEECVLTGTHTVSQADVDAGVVSNTVTAEANELTTAVTARQQTQVARESTLTLTKTTTATGFTSVGGTIVYSYEVTNSGTVTLSGTLAISDDKIASADISCGAVPDGGLVPSASVTCSGTYTVVQADLDAGGVTNKATASLDGVTSNEATATVPWKAPQAFTEPQVSIGLAVQVAEDAGTAEVAVSLTESSLQTVTVDYATSDGTATAGTDYVAASATLTFAPGETEKKIRVTITDDEVDEEQEDETFTVTLSSPNNASLDVSSSTVTITDDDDPAVTASFGQASYSVAEGSTVEVTVTLSADPERAVTVLLTHDPQGGASSGDYSGVPGSLIFQIGDTEKSFTFSATGDDIDDDGESVALGFGATPDGVTAGTTATVTITDDDTAGVTVSESALSIDEGGSDTYTVKLDTEPTADVTVAIAGHASTDISLSGDTLTNNALTFTASNWGTAQTVTVTAAADDDAASDAAVTLTHTVSGTGEYAGVTAGSVRVTIVEKDASVVSVGNAEAAEDGGNVVFTVSISAAGGGEVTVAYATSGDTATAGEDYTETTGTLTFPADSTTSRTISVPVTDDTVDEEEEETFTLTLSNVQGASLSGGGSTLAVTGTITDDDDPAVTASFGLASYSVAEGSTVEVTVTLSADPEREVTVPLTHDPQGDTGSSDYSGVPGSLIFQIGDTEKSFTFRAASDDIDDDGESVVLGFGTMPDDVTAGTTATVSITDDDTAGVTVSQSALEVDEGGSDTYTVVLDTQPSSSVTVTIAGHASTDITLSGDTLTNNALTFTASTWDTAQPVTVTAASDNDAASDTAVTLTHTANGGGYVDVQETVTVTIVEKDASVLSVGNAEAAEDGGNVVFTVSISAAAGGEVTVAYATSGDTATAGEDYTETTGTLTFAANSVASQTISVPVTDDAVDEEEEETFTLTLSNVQGASLSGGGSTLAVTGTITDDDDPAVTASFKQSAYGVAEGSTVEITVTLSADPEREVAIRLSHDPQGDTGTEDYSGVPGSLVFQGGDTEKSFTFRAVADDIDDDGESVRLGFGTMPDGVTAGTTATVSITDDDTAGVRVSETALTIDEGGSGTYTVVLDTEPTADVTVAIAGHASTDISLSGDTLTNNALTFTSDNWDTAQTVTVTAAADDDAASDAAVTLTHTVTGTGEYAGVTAGSVTVTIVEKDASVLSVGDAEAAEDGGNVVFTVSISAAGGGEVTVAYATSGDTATAGEDYTETTGTLTFAANSVASQTISVPVTDDAVDEEEETFTLTLSNVQGASLSGGTSTLAVTGTITDNDNPAVTASFKQSAYGVAEGSTVEVTVTLSADPERAVTVLLTHDPQGGASSGDYSGVPGSLIFQIGDTEKSFTFRAVADDIDDDGESVRLGFGTMPDRVLAGTTATVSINDDDTAGVTVSETALSIDEGGSDTYTVKLDTKPTADVTVAIAGQASTDLSLDKTSLTFTSDDWDTAQTVRVAAGADDDAASDTAVTLTHTANGGGYVDVQETLTVTIVEKDASVLSVGDAEAAEDGGNVVFTVSISAASGEAVTVAYATSGDTATAGEDYTETTGTLTFAANSVASQTISVPVTDDAVDEEEETFTLTLSNVQGASLSGGTSTLAVTGTITDNDNPAVTASFKQANYSVVEGSTVEVTVTLSADPEREVTVNLTKTDQGGVTGSDYSGVPGSLVFQIGDTEKSFTFSATADDIDDDGESVALGFGTLPDGVTAGTTATVTITDDDTAGVTVSQSALEVDEGDSATYTVKLDTKPTGDVTVTIAGHADTDITLSGDTLTNNALTFTAATWNTAQTVTVTAASDNDAASDTAVTLTHTANGGGYVDVQETVTVTIVEKDASVLSVGDAEAAEDGGNVEFTVSISAAAGEEVTVDYATSNGTATAGQDYTSTTGTLTFAANSVASQTISVPVTDDAVDEEEEETFTLTLSNVQGASLSGGGSTLAVTGTITDDDDPAVTASFGQASYSVAEGSTVEVTVTLSADPERAVTVLLTHDPQGGASSGDYSGVPGSLIFQIGDTEKSFTFSAAADDIDDDGESVALGFGATPDGVSAGTTATVTITDDDTAGVRVSETALTIDEGGNDTYTVKLDTEPTADVTVAIAGHASTDITLSGDTLTNNALTFTASNWGTAQTVTVTAAADDDAASDASVILTHTANGGGYVDVQETVTVTIVEKDASVLSVGNAEAAEDGGNVVFTVSISAAAGGEVTVAYATSGDTATAGQDYTETTGTLTFAANSVASQTISVPVTDDAVDEEEEETFTLTLSNAQGASLSGGASTLAVTGTITDDDDPAVTASFGLASYSVAEGSTVEVTVTLSADPERAVTVLLTHDPQGGASSDDYSGVPGGLIFQIGDTEKSFTFSATGDDIDDDGESVALGFGTLPNRVSAGTTATVSINDDDTAGVTVSESALSIDEGGNDTYTVKLDTEPTADVTVAIAGHSGTDISLSGGTLTDDTLTFTSDNWDTAQTVTVAAGADDDTNADPAVTLTHTVTGGDYEGLNAAGVTVSVTENDQDTPPGVTVSFEKDYHNLAEGASGAGVGLLLSAALASDVTIPIVVLPKSTAGAEDYSGVPNGITFAAGETYAYFWVHPEADAVEEEDEQVWLGLDSLPDGVSAGSNSRTYVRIIDSVHVSFGSSNYSATEGEADAVVTVRLNKPLPDGETIPLTAEGGSGATSDDWSGVPDELYFAAGETEKTFTVTAVDDTVEDDGEMVTLGFGTLSDRLIAVSPATATITLMNIEERTSAGLSACSDSSSMMVSTEEAPVVYSGNIETDGRTEWFNFYLEPYRSHVIEIRGVDTGDGTLENPALLQWRAALRLFHVTLPVPSPASGNRNVERTVWVSLPGVYCFEVASGDNGTGTYQLELRVNEDRMSGGGPDGYGGHDVPADTSTRITTRLDIEGMSGYLGDDGAAGDDEDWFRIDLTGGVEYQIDLEPLTYDLVHEVVDGRRQERRVPIEERYWLTHPRIAGVHDANGTVIEDTASAGEDMEVSVDFTPPADGAYYIAVGSNSGDRTGLFQLCVKEKGSSGTNRCNEEAPPEQGSSPQRVEAENSPATGGPGIGGTPRVGETLTAATEGISDEDGLTRAVFTYQWVRHDFGTGTDTDIGGATGASYTVASYDAGHGIKVRLTFTDDAGHEESLTSYAAAVQAQPLTAEFPQSPYQSQSHKGADDRPQVIVAFSRAVASIAETTPSVLVAGGTVSGVRAHEEDGLDHAWVFFLDPAGTDDIHFTLLSGRSCEAGGICAADGTTLFDAPATRTIPGPEEETEPQQQQREPEEPPAKPTGLEATASHDTVTLTWDDPGDDSITGYVILRRVRVNDQGGDFDVLVADTGTAALTYTDDTVAAGLTYTYRIKAINGAGTSERSRWFHIDTPAAP